MNTKVKKIVINKRKPGILHPSSLLELSNSDPSAALQSGKLMAKAWGKSLVEKGEVPPVQIFIFHIIEAYWQKIHEEWELPPVLPLLFKKFTVKRLDEAVLAVAKAIGTAAAKLPVIEASYQLGNVYTSLLPETDRASAGVFYTPPSLSHRLIDMATDAGVNWATARVIDPACGGGAFLTPMGLKIAAALGDRPAKEILIHIQTHLVGWEIDAFGGWLTQVFVEAALKDTIKKAGIRPKPLVKIVDSLEIPKLKENERFDLVMGNPPYGKLKLTSFIRERYKDSLYGHPNYYGLFTHLALDLTRKGGMIALLTPTSFLSGEYFKNLRILIRQQSLPKEIDFVAIRKGVFEDVLQETMLTVYLKKPAIRATVRVNLLEIGLNDVLQIATSGEFLLPLDLSAPWILPRTPEQVRPVKAMQNMGCILKDWGYKVSTGPLVWNRHKKQLFDKKEGPSFYPVVWAEAVTATGEFILRAEKKNHKSHFKFKEGDDWLVTKKPCILLQRTTAKEQGKRLIAAALPSQLLQHKKGVVIENHLNMILPLNGTPVVSPEVLAVFLNSRATNEAFRAISGSVAISAYELESLALPGPEELAGLEEIIRNGSNKEAIEISCLQLYTADNA